MLRRCRRGARRSRHRSCGTAGADADLAKQVAQLLRDMPADHPACKTAKCLGWSAPLDYKPVTQCLRELEYGAFAQVE